MNSPYEGLIEPENMDLIDLKNESNDENPENPENANIEYTIFPRIPPNLHIPQYIIDQYIEDYAILEKDQSMVKNRLDNLKLDLDYTSDYINARLVYKYVKRDLESFYLCCEGRFDDEYVIDFHIFYRVLCRIAEDRLYQYKTGIIHANEI